MDLNQMAVTAQLRARRVGERDRRRELRAANHRAIKNMFFHLMKLPQRVHDIKGQAAELAWLEEEMAKIYPYWRERLGCGPLGYQFYVPITPRPCQTVAPVPVVKTGWARFWDFVRGAA